MIPSFDESSSQLNNCRRRSRKGFGRWLEDRGATNAEEHGSHAHANRSAKSLRWLHENREKYSGQWVALGGDRLIASGSTAKEVYSKATAEGVEIPFVEVVTNPEPVPFTGGWLS